METNKDAHWQDPTDHQWHVTSNKPQDVGSELPGKYCWTIASKKFKKTHKKKTIIFFDFSHYNFSIIKI